MPRRIVVSLAVLTIALLAGCAGSERAARAPLSERERDSVLARSGLPGAEAVGHALSVSDRAAKRAAGADAADSLFR